MSLEQDRLTVYYDGSCQKCIRDRKNYERLSGKERGDVLWIDITDKDEELRKIGIDPHKALTELHVKDENQKIHSEIDAYIMLMSKVLVLKPLAWFIGLPLIRPLLSRIYHWQVNRRLRLSRRL